MKTVYIATMLLLGTMSSVGENTLNVQNQRPFNNFSQTLLIPSEENSIYRSRVTAPISSNLPQSTGDNFAYLVGNYTERLYNSSGQQTYLALNGVSIKWPDTSTNSIVIYDLGATDSQIIIQATYNSSDSSIIISPTQSIANKYLEPMYATKYTFDPVLGKNVLLSDQLVTGKYKPDGTITFDPFIYVMGGAYQGYTLGTFRYQTKLSKTIMTTSDNEITINYSTQPDIEITTTANAKDVISLQLSSFSNIGIKLNGQPINKKSSLSPIIFNLPSIKEEPNTINIFSDSLIEVTMIKQNVDTFRINHTQDSLITIALSENNLTSIDLIHTPKLKYLNVANNKLKKLNCSSNSNLEWVTCNNNTLDTILLPTANRISYINCNYNPLKQILFQQLASLYQIEFINTQLPVEVINKIYMTIPMGTGKIYNDNTPGSYNALGFYPLEKGWQIIGNVGYGENASSVTFSDVEFLNGNYNSTYTLKDNTTELGNYKINIHPVQGSKKHLYIENLGNAATNKILASANISTKEIFIYPRQKIIIGTDSSFIRKLNESMTSYYVSSGVSGYYDENNLITFNPYGFQSSSTSNFVKVYRKTELTPIETASLNNLDNKLIWYVQDNTLIVINRTTNKSPIQLFYIDGSIIFTGISSGQLQIPLPTPGVYLLEINNEIYKVVR